MAGFSACVLEWCAATLLVCLVCLVRPSCSYTTDEYCAECANNTMCLFPDADEVGDACKEGELVTGVDVNQKNVIVDLHNQRRNTVALGQEPAGSPGPQPAAANMLPLAWSDDLSEVAQRWADQCTFEHDSCRNLPGVYVGQNLYLWYISLPCEDVDDQQDWTGAVDSWYNEVSQMDGNSVGNYAGASNVGHYTQLVWAETSSVGCGYSSFQNGDQCKKLYACNYAPGGNYLGEPVYQQGDARTACPSAPTQDTYPGLC